jgi:hypothetical protein
MKVLLDEMVDVRFRRCLPGHDVFSVDYLKWKGLKNGAIIARAAAERFARDHHCRYRNSKTAERRCASACDPCDLFEWK